VKNHNLDPVHLAVLEHSVTDVRSALSRGNEVDGLDRERRTPLFYAAKDGNVEIVSELLSHGANPNMRDKSLETPLHFAAREYRPEVAQRLLNAGATVDAQDIHGNTPLARAVYSSRGKGEMIKLLLSHGADKTLANKHGISPEKLAETIANYDVRQFMQ
jgi:ankyrin repeat protein